MQSSKGLQEFISGLTDGKQVAILGFGREGQSTYRYLRRLFPKIKLTILDQSNELGLTAKELVGRDNNLEFILGSEYLSRLNEFNIIFKSPGVSPYLLEIQKAINQGVKITSQTDILFSLFGPQVIAITGTKGKSTACHVLTQLLETNGKTVLFIGNVGAPALDSVGKITEDAVIVYETSSHQCEGLTVSPHWAVLLNLYQDHLDYYPDLEAYAMAKRQLFFHQKSDDYLLVNVGDKQAVSLTNNIPSTKVGFTLEKDASASVYIENDWIIAFGEKLMSIREIPLLGIHNILNCLPAVIMGHLLGLENEEIARALRKVRPMVGRLSEVGTVGGVKFIDDALATIPEATIAALEALGPDVTTLIAGGFDRGQDFTQLAKNIAKSHVKHLVLFPTTGEKIAKLVEQFTNDISTSFVSNMDDAVKTALLHTQKGKIVLLSAASASFGLFKDYKDRSEQLWHALNL